MRPRPSRHRKPTLEQLFDFSDVYPPRDPIPTPDTRDHDELFAQGLITQDEWHRREFFPPLQPQSVQNDSAPQADSSNSWNSFELWYPTGPTANPCDIFNERHRQLHRLAALGFMWPAHLPEVAPWEPTWASASTSALHTANEDSEMDMNDPGAPPAPLEYMADLAQALPTGPDPEPVSDEPEILSLNFLGTLDALGLLESFRTRRVLGQRMVRNNLTTINPSKYALICPLRNENGYGQCQAGLLPRREFEEHLYNDHLKSSPWVCTLAMPPTTQLCEQELVFGDCPKNLGELQASGELRAILRHICTFRHRQLLFGCQIQRYPDGSWKPIEEISLMPLLQCKFCSETWNSLLWGCQNALRQHVQQEHPEQLR